MMCDIALADIVVPKDRRKSFDKTDEKLRVFLDSVHRVGLINPIDVRKAGDHFELVIGRKRLWAAQQLGWTAILSRVGDWSDAQLGFLITAENLLRTQLSAADQALALQKLLKELEAAFGPDLGRASGGIARAKKERDPDSKVFLPNKVVENHPTEPTHPVLPIDPAFTAAVNAGGKSPEPRSHTTLVAQVLGKSVNRTHEDVKLAQSFTAEQLQTLSDLNLSKSDLLKLADLPSPEARDRAVVLVGGGLPVAQVVTLLQEPAAQKALKQVQEDDLPDQEWLASYAGPLRDRVQDPAAFDRDALLYRHTREERLAFRAAVKKEALAARNAGYSPFGNLVARLLWVQHPSAWLLCGECTGRNRQHPHCESCYGCGFKLTYDIPARK